MQKHNYKSYFILFDFNINFNICRQLLLYGSTVDCLDSFGLTPLHLASKWGTDSNAISLLEFGANANKTGGPNKLTPLLMAETYKMVQILLHAGNADPYAKTKSKSAFSLFLGKNNQAASDILSQGLTTNGKDLDSKDLLLIYDFTVFRNEISTSDIMDEMSVHKQIVDMKEQELLKHPLVESFLYIKWRLCKRISLANFLLYMTFSICFTIFALLTTNMVKSCKCTHDDLVLSYNSTNVMDQLFSYLQEDYCEGHATSSKNVRGGKPFWKLKPFLQLSIMECLDSDPYLFWILLALTLISTFLLAVRETIQAIANPKGYLEDPENFLQLSIIGSVLAYIGFLLYYVDMAAHFGAFGVFLAYIDVTLMIGRSPSIGLYIYMALHVVKLLLILLSVYSTTLLAFAIAFHILLPNNKVFQNMFTSGLKVKTT